MWCIPDGPTSTYYIAWKNSLYEPCTTLYGAPCTTLYDTLYDDLVRRPCSSTLYEVCTKTLYEVLANAPILVRPLVRPLVRGLYEVVRALNGHSLPQSPHVLPWINMGIPDRFYLNLYLDKMVCVG